MAPESRAPTPGVQAHTVLAPGFPADGSVAGQCDFEMNPDRGLRSMRSATVRGVSERGSPCRRLALTLDDLAPRRGRPRAEVDVDHVTSGRLVGEAECLVACRRRTGDLDPLLLEQPARGVQELPTVVDDQAAQLSDRHGRRASQTRALARTAASRKSRGSGGREVDWALASMIRPPEPHTRSSDREKTQEVHANMKRRLF